MSEKKASSIRTRPPPGTSFPRAARLASPRDFRRVFENASVSSDRCFKVLACAGTGARSRLGMAVSRQVDRRSVVRNRIKRIIRESFRQHLLLGGDAWDIVVLPRRESATISNQRLHQSLSQHWIRLHGRLADAGAALGADSAPGSDTAAGGAGPAAAAAG